MRYSYGIMDQRKILLYKPQLFLKSNDLLIFPSSDFHKWHANIKEYIDGLYQINASDLNNDKSINIIEFNLAFGVLNNIAEEFKNIFDSEKVSDFSHHYISTLDEKHRKLRDNSYTNDMRRCDIRIPVKPEITPDLKYEHMMEIVDYAYREFLLALKEGRTCRLSRMKKQKNLNDLLNE